jgi:hypothetical protein
LNLKVDKTTTVNSYALSSNITLAKADVGLGNVDNTSDASKPVSTAQQTALNLKVDTATINTANGVAGLDASSKISVSQLPALSLGGASLTDVQVSAPTDGQVLAYNTTSSKWTNAAASGGGANLAQNEIVIGVGEATVAPTTVLLRGPQANGANVKPGDVIIRAEGGTGSWGSGTIRFQTAQAATVHPILHFQTSTQSTSVSYEVLVPSGFSNVLALLIVSCQTSTSTVTAMTLNGTNFTSLTTLANAAVGNITIAYLANPTSGSCAVTLSLSSYVTSQLVFFENATIASDAVGQYLASGTLSSVNVPNVQEGDFVLDYNMFRNSSPNTYLYSIPSAQSLYFTKSYGITPYNISTMSTSAGVSGTVNMRRTYTSNTNALLVACRIQMYRNTSSTTAATFSDAIVITGLGRQIMTQLVPTAFYESFEFTAVAGIKFLTPTSPRFQILKNTTGSNKTIVLPRADMLPIGTTFFFDTSASTSGSNIFVIPRYGGFGEEFSLNGPFTTTSFGATMGPYVSYVSSTTTVSGRMGPGTKNVLNYLAQNYCRVELVAHDASGCGHWFFFIGQSSANALFFV